MQGEAWIGVIGRLLRRIYDELVEFFRFFSAIMVLVACFIWSIIVLLFLPFWILFRRWRKKRFLKHLANFGRCVSWYDFMHQKKYGKGTVIIEVGNKLHTRYWWTEDRIIDLTPIAIPPFNKIDIYCSRVKDQQPFNKWCHEHYVSHQTGKAFLVYPLAADFETLPFGEDYEERIKKQFPEQQVIILTFYDIRYA